VVTLRDPRVRLATWYFLYLGAIGAVGPFLAVVLGDLGASGAATAGILALFPIGLLSTGPLGTLLADRSGRADLVLRLSLALAAIGAVGLVVAPSWQWMIPAAILIALCRAPSSAIVDNLSVRGLPQGMDSYGQVRLWGSVGFIAAAALAGGLYETEPRAPLALGALLLLGTLAVTWTLPTVGREANEETAGPGHGEALRTPASETESARPRGGAIRLLLGQPVLRALCIIAVIHSATVSIYDHFFALHVKSLGLSPAIAGQAIALGVGVEVMVMAWGRSLLAWLGPRRLVLIAITISIPRWWLSGILTSPAALIAVQASHGLTFGAWWVGAIALVSRHAPSQLRNSAQGLFLASGHGLGSLLAMAGAAVLLDRIGTSMTFKGLAVVSLVGALLAWQLLMRQGVSSSGNDGSSLSTSS